MVYLICTFVLPLFRMQTDASHKVNGDLNGGPNSPGKYSNSNYEGKLGLTQLADNAVNE